MFVRRKILRGKAVNYAVKTFREGGKVKQRQCYLGNSPSIEHRIKFLQRCLRVLEKDRKVAEDPRSITSEELKLVAISGEASPKQLREFLRCKKAGSGFFQKRAVQTQRQIDELKRFRLAIR